MKLVLSRIIPILIGFVFVFTANAVWAQLFKPHEPLDPAKAQSLPLTPMSITTSKGKFDFQVEVADDFQKRAIGLMHRSALAMDHGMLFDMKVKAPVRFWMRNTFIPLDMFFVSSDGAIQFIAENTIPHDERGTGPGPNVPVSSVLELKGGAAQFYGIHVGDKITHDIFLSK